MGHPTRKLSFWSHVYKIVGRAIPRISIDMFSKFSSDLSQEDESLQSMSKRQGLERRASIRVCYPQTGPVGNLPNIIINNEEFRGRDISVGGLCIYDPSRYLGTEIGVDLQIELDWGGEKMQITATIIAITLNHCHVKMAELNLKFIELMNAFLQPGYLGKQFFRVGDFDALERSQITEMWVTTTGDNFVIYKDDHFENKISEFTCLGVTTEIYKNSPPTIKYYDKNHSNTFVLDQNILNDQVICLANFKNSSSEVKRVLKLLQDHISMGRKVS